METEHFAWEYKGKHAKKLAKRRDSAGNQSVRTRLNNELGQMIGAFLERLSTIRVLDPACGSGNFLYVALRMLLDLWKEVTNFATTLGLPLMLTTSAPSPEQLFGIEIDAYAHELAQATVWIGYIQWLHENGYGIPSEPILRKLDNIKHMDAILAYDEDGKPVEPEWPVAEVIVGNPPFLGGNKIRYELGDAYVDSLFLLYAERVPGSAFERARKQIQDSRLKRAGLLATHGIRGGVNRRVLEKIKQSGDIFMAWSDRPWVLDGAAVRVSMVGFDDGSQATKHLNDSPISNINPALSSSADITSASVLLENRGLSFRGNQKGGPFDIPDNLAKKMLSYTNPNGRPNSDVVRRWVNGLDITRSPRNMWLIDFGNDMAMEEASLYEEPFEYVKRYVYPILYNARPTWLDLAHAKLDVALLAAYGWSDLMADDGITDEEELLSRLLTLNLERAGAQGELQPILLTEDEDES